jgi:hypothetical protein
VKIKNRRSGSIYLVTLVFGLLFFYSIFHSCAVDMLSLLRLQKAYLVRLNCTTGFTKDEFMLGAGEVLVCPVELEDRMPRAVEWGEELK